MAIAHMISIINALAYGVIPIGIWWIVVRFPALRLALLGLFIHMSLVCLRSALRVTHPYSVLWDWSDIHTATAVLSASCFGWTIGRTWWRERFRQRAATPGSEF